jgi:hypothetical protein
LDEYILDAVLYQRLQEGSTGRIIHIISRSLCTRFCHFLHQLSLSCILAKDAGTSADVEGHSENNEPDDAREGRCAAQVKEQHLCRRRAEYSQG